MLLPHPTDAIHQAWLYRILAAVADDAYLAEVLRFKGGTCAAMRGLIERFSVDLDFDLLESSANDQVKDHLKKIFRKLGLEIKDQSQHVPQFFLKYHSPKTERNTVRLDVTFPVPKSNTYEPVRFIEIDRIFYCQTVETMFANKLAAVLDRYEKHGSIAGRDLYDIHTFLLNGFEINEKVIEERRGKSTSAFLRDLVDFIDKKVTQKAIDEDLNHLLPVDQFKKVHRIIKQEVVMLLRARDNSGFALAS